MKKVPRLRRDIYTLLDDREYLGLRNTPKEVCDKCTFHRTTEEVRSYTWVGPNLDWVIRGELNRM